MRLNIRPVARGHGSRAPACPGAALGAAISVLTIPARAASQAPTPAPSRAVRLAVDNDLLALRGTGPPPDYDYTHGTRAAVAWAHAPRWAGRLTRRAPARAAAEARRRGCLIAAAELAQEIYTPRRDAPRPVPGERPYAAWLSASGTVATVTPGRVHAFSLALGTTGPPALGEPVQNGVHRVLGSTPQLGWPHQLAARPTLAVRYDAARWTERPLGRATVGALRVRYGATAGTALTALTAGADLVVGRRAPLPWTPAEPEVDRPTRAYVRLGYRQDVVPHNAFVDGWRAGGAAARRAWVPQDEVGLGYRWRRGAVEYRHVVRGREYRAQPNPHAYGAVAVTVDRF